MAGVDSDGFTKKSRDEIINDISYRMKSKFGEQFDTSPESPDGQLIGIMADLMYDQWQLAEDCYNSYDPAVTPGVGLDNLVRLNGIRRIEDRPTIVAVQLDGTAGTLVPAGSLVETNTGDLQFETEEDVVLPGETNGICTTLGEFDVGANEVQVISSGSEVSGWDTVDNAEPGTSGVDQEEDAELRARRERSVIRSGTSTAEAIYSAVADLDLEFIAIIENDTDITSPDGVPPHSFHTIAEGGTLQDIAERVYHNKAIGIQAYGDNIIVVTDSQGYPHNIGISRPTQVDIEVSITYIRAPGSSLVGPDNVKQNVIDYINDLQISEDVIWSRLFNPANSEEGVVIEDIFVGYQGQTLGTDNLPIAVSEKAVTEDMYVTMTDVTP